MTQPADHQPHAAFQWVQAGALQPQGSHSGVYQGARGSRVVPTHLEAFQEALTGPGRGLEVRKEGGAEGRDGRKGARWAAEQGVSDGKGPCINMADREKL